jgi:hypothetical protein
MVTWKDETIWKDDMNFEINYEDARWVGRALIVFFFSFLFLFFLLIFFFTFLF